MLLGSVAVLASYLPVGCCRAKVLGELSGRKLIRPIGEWIGELCKVHLRALKMEKRWISEMVQNGLQTLRSTHR